MSARLTSLDAFRGATIALMVLVNTPGDGRHVYPPLEHADWNGWTPTDVVFPSFLFIVGVAIVLSRRKSPLQVLRRAAILYAFGLFLYGFPKYDLHTLRLLGVLQRIAICYAAACFISYRFGVRGVLAWIAGLLTVYWALMVFVPVPGYGPGDLAPGHNLSNYIDRIVLGSHNYAPTKIWDPEGILSTLPAIATALFGVLAGHVLRAPHRVARLIIFGAGLIAAGLICDHWMPINKKLWTTSFALFMAGLDFVLFAAFLWVADERGWRRPFQPFVILGMNAIAVYMAAEMLDEVLRQLHVRGPIYRTVFAHAASPVNASLLYALAYVGVMFLIAWALWRRRIFLRV